MADFAMNSVFAKVHALYAKRITTKNYKELLSLSSVSEIADYLRTKTAYSEIFEGVSGTNELSRSRLENLLFNKMFNEMVSVIRFQNAAGNKLFEYFIYMYDTQQIIKVLSSIETKSDSYFFSFPVFYNERSQLDLYKLAKAQSDSDILECTKNTVYYNTLANAMPEYRLTGNLTAVQSSFRNFLDEKFLSLISNGKKNSSNKSSELINLYKTINDINLIRVIFRIKRFDFSDTHSQQLVMPSLTLLTKRQLIGLFEAKDTNEAIDELKKTYLSEIAEKAENGKISHAAENFMFSLLSKTVSRSTDPQTVMFAYFNLAQAEIRNIIHIIEGVRYSLGPEEIEPLIAKAQQR